MEGYKWEETILPLKDFERKELMHEYIYIFMSRIDIFPLILIFAFVSNEFDRVVSMKKFEGRINEVKACAGKYA